jgi:protein SCO1/2
MSGGAALATALLGALALAWLLPGAAGEPAREGMPTGSGAAEVAPPAPGPYRLSPAGRWVRAFPGVELTTHEGRAVRFYDDLLRDRGAIVNFMYTSCLDRCPLATHNLAQVRALLGDRVGRDLVMLSITVDPARDTPEALARFAAAHGAGAGWQFLTGTRASLEAVQRSLGIGGASAAERDLHTDMLVVGHEARGRWARIDALAPPARIAAFVRRIVDQ